MLNLIDYLPVLYDQEDKKDAPKRCGPFITQLKKRGKIIGFSHPVSETHFIYYKSYIRMKTKGNTIFITGGNAGIGLALAEIFLKEGNTVIICGRNEQKLQEVSSRLPEIHTEACDISKAEERTSLAERLLNKYPGLNVLVNNAGIQQRFNFLKTPLSWEDYRKEIATNLDAPLHLISLLLPHLVKQSDAAILNVSSALAFAPMAAAPVYCATKAALHNFTISLRYQLSETSVEVIEIIPPMVNTNLGGAGLHLNAVSPEEFAGGVLKGLENGIREIGYGTSEKAMLMSREESDNIVKMLNTRIPY